MSIGNIFNELNPSDDKCPYICNIKISLDFSKILPDNSSIQYLVPEGKLENEHGISKHAVFTVFGFNLNDCINKTKAIITQLNYEKNER